MPKDKFKVELAVVDTGKVRLMTCMSMNLIAETCGRRALARAF